MHDMIHTHYSPHFPPTPQLILLSYLITHIYTHTHLLPHTLLSLLPLLPHTLPVHTSPFPAHILQAHTFLLLEYVVMELGYVPIPELTSVGLLLQQ